MNRIYKIMHCANESILDDIEKTPDAKASEEIARADENRLWNSQPEHYRFMFVASIHNKDYESLEDMAEKLIKASEDVCLSCLRDYEISPVVYSCIDYFADGHSKYIKYLPDEISRGITFNEDLDTTANIRIQFNIPRRFQNFIRIVMNIWNITYGNPLMLVETMQAYKSVRVNDSYQWEFVNTHLGYISADILYASKVDINNFNTVFQAVQKFYYGVEPRVTFDDVKAYIEKLRDGHKHLNESVLDTLDNNDENRRMSDILSGQADAAYWDERPDTHSNMITVSVICGTEEMLWNTILLLKDKLELLSEAYLNNVDISICTTSDTERNYYIDEIPDFVVRTSEDDPFYSLVKKTANVKQAQIRIQFDPPKDYRKMTRFISNMYENCSHVAHVITTCTIWKSDGRDYLETVTATEIVNRIFKFVSELCDESCETYAEHLQSALLPFYHTRDNEEKSTINKEDAIQFIKSINKRALELREKKGEQVFR